METFLRCSKVVLGLVICVTVTAVFSGQVFATEDELTVSFSTNQVVLDALPEQFTSGGQTITVSTTNPTGYTANLITTGASTSLINIVDDTLTIPTFSLPDAESSLSFGSTGYGYGYSIDGGLNYLPVPSPSSAGHEIFETRTSGVQNHVLTFGAMIEQGTVAGEYSNTFLIQVVTNDPYVCAADSICYRGNGDDGAGTMDVQATGSNTSVMLRASNFSRSGYGFAGWNTEPDGSGTNYGPSQTITTSDLSEFGLMLYANWIPSSGNLQEWHGCEAMSIGEIIALTDTRDDNTYAIAKYVDGNCWFMENMRLDLSNSDLEISALNTNNPTAEFIAAVNSHPTSTNNFCTGTNADCLDQILFNTNNMNRSLIPAYDTNDASSSWYSYGGYYNWYTATAGHGTYSFATTGAVVSGDLCPAGWRMPTAFSSNDDYAKLDKAIGGTGASQTSGDAGIASSARWRSYPLNYIYSGEQNGASAYNRGISGGYNTVNTSNNARSVNLWIRSAGVSVSNNTTAKSRGQTIRCLSAEKYEATGTIHYDSNGGTGTMPDQVDVNLVTVTASVNVFTKADNEFLNWNTKADGTGTIVAEGGSVIAAANDMGVVEGGTLTLYAIWRPIYSIIYDGNGADAGSMDSANHSNYDPSNSVTLIPTNFSRAGYGFAGWSLDIDAVNKLQNGEPVTIYGPNETVPANNTFPANANADNTITLYAVWLPATVDMQDFGVSECQALSVGDVIALTDDRDNNSYSVAKLADGNCWMAENLRLDPSTAAFTNTNTNSPTQEFIDAVPTSASENILCNVNTPGCVNEIAFNSNNLNRDLVASYSSNNSTSSWYSYGMMYNWYTVSVGNGTSDTSSGDVAGDICPAGWRLPTGGTANMSEIFTLNTVANSGKLNDDAGLRNYPNNFIYSGDYNTSKPSGRGSYGRYWTSTASSDYNAYRLGLAVTEVTPVRTWNKWVAFAARCMIEDPTTTPAVAPANDTVTEANAPESSSEVSSVSTSESTDPAISVDVSDSSLGNTGVATIDAIEYTPDTKSSYREPLGETEVGFQPEKDAPELDYQDATTVVVTASTGAAILALVIVSKRSKEEL